MNRIRPALVVMALLASIGVLVASGEENQATSVDESGQSNDSSGSQPAKNDPPAAFAVGELVELGDWQVRVHGVQDPLEIAPDDMFAPDEGLRRVVIDAEVTNNGDKDETVSSLLCFEIKDRKNRTYEQALFVDSPVGSLDGDVPPGGSLRGEIAYDVPEDAKRLVLSFKCDLFSSGSASIALS